MQRFLSIIFLPLSLLRLIVVIFISLTCVILVIIESQISIITKKYRFVTLRCWGKAMLLTLGISVKRNQKVPRGAYIIMANHRSYIDIFIMAAFAPGSFVAKAELQKWPFIGQAAKAAKIIMVKREDMKSLLDTMKKIRQNVENGLPVVVFPEGTTTQEPGLKPFKNGTFKIASEIKAEIIPCAISYKNNKLAWIGNDSFLAHFFREMWRPLNKAYFLSGKPASSGDYRELKAKTKDTIKDLLNSIGNK